MSTTANLIQLYSDDARTQAAYPICHEKGIFDDNGNEVITDLKSDLSQVINCSPQEYQNFSNYTVHANKRLGYSGTTPNEIDATGISVIIIPCQAGDKFYWNNVKFGYGGTYRTLLCNGDTIVSVVENWADTTVTGTDKYYTVPSGVNNIRTATDSATVSSMILKKYIMVEFASKISVDNLETDVKSEISETQSILNACYIKTSSSDNLFDNSQEFETGFLASDGTLDTASKWASYCANKNPIYLESGYYCVYAKPNSDGTYPWIRIAIAVYKKDGTFKKYIYQDKVIQKEMFWFGADSYIKISTSKGSASTIMIAKETNYKTYVNFVPKYIPDFVQTDNVLYGKKYVACGDSFTEGSFSGYADAHGKTGTDSPTIYDEDISEYKTYPYWIAKRNHMTLVNEAITGSAMGYKNQSDSFSVTRYKNIPEDADYITLKFGINDDSYHQNIPLGTIDDNTNTTFYGAWNIVLEYLIEHHPFAKIGVIITNGMQDFPQYPQAIIAVCKKWGIAYFDETFAENITCMLRSNRANLCERAKTLRWNQQIVADTNSHPNIEAHKYESTMIEAWLRTL